MRPPTWSSSSQSTTPSLLRVWNGELQAFMASCDERREVCDRTLARFAITDWGEPPVVVIDRAAHERVLDRMNDTSRRVLERAVAEADDIFLYLEDDLEFNRSLRHDLEHWPPLVDRLAGDHFFGSLYNPDVVAVASQQDPRSFTVAEPDKVYGSQAFVLSVATARWILDHWDDVPGLPDIRFSRLAARRSPIYYHRPSLVQHRPVDSTWGGTQHAANDFSPNWRPPEAPERRGAGVLVVEDRAHLTSGHYPGRFADLAEGFAALGHPVDVLTAHGWSQSRPVPFTVHRYGPITRWLAERGPRARVAAMILAARRLRRTVGGAPAVVVVSDGVDPVLADAIARRGAWLFYEFAPPPDAPPGLWDRAIGRLGRFRRRTRGAIGIPTAYWADRWRARAPHLDVHVLPIAGTRRHVSIPDARSRLGITGDERVALVFGSQHDGKDTDVIWRAATDLPGWQLVVGGPVADSVPAELVALRFDGGVDVATRDLLFAAADVVVLSFRSNYVRDSSTLMDALSFGVPVVCSTRSTAGDLVQNYRLGTVFEPGDADSLRAALRDVPSAVDPRDLERARLELSNTVVALRFLDAIGQLR
jgi:glycosyltransferase involved in cell wall biosynthesis